MTYAMNFRRSSVVPQTIARETAQNMNWNSMKAAVEPVTGPSTRPPLIVSPVEKKKPESPMIAPAPPKARANPQAHQAIVAIEKFTRIFAIPMPAFLPREKPISRNAKPACMNITSTAATRTQVTLSSSVSVSMPLTALPPRFRIHEQQSQPEGRRGLWPAVESSPLGLRLRAGGLPAGETQRAHVCPRGHPARGWAQLGCEAFTEEELPDLCHAFAARTSPQPSGARTAAPSGRPT